MTWPYVPAFGSLTVPNPARRLARKQHAQASFGDIPLRPVHQTPVCVMINGLKFKKFWGCSG